MCCTQEQQLFVDLAAATQGANTAKPIRFVNIRETGGWSRDAKVAAPKMAALIAAAQMPIPDPVPAVNLQSLGRCLVLGSAQACQGAARLLGDELQVSLLIEQGELPQQRAWDVHVGRLNRLQGWLGAFEAEWQTHNPIDLDLCTRCNACIEACPEGAIDFSYQIDLQRCKASRDCVRVCDGAQAIDFARPAQQRSQAFDLVLDLRSSPAFSQHQLPPGYFYVGGDTTKLFDAVLALRNLTGEFEKPRHVQYKPKLCAHGRNAKVACQACIDVCSASAITSDLKGSRGIKVNNQLCAGCGACTSVCPSGALSYGTPTAVYQTHRIKTMLTAYAAAQPVSAPVLLVHSDKAGRQLIDDLGRAARVDADFHGVPAHVLPVDVAHTASWGLELWLMGLCYGAAGVWILQTGEEAEQYRSSVAQQAEIANALWQGFGFAGQPIRVLHARDARDLAALDLDLRTTSAAPLSLRASFAAQADKRTNLELALDHLMACAPSMPGQITLPAVGSPLGGLHINIEACTLCLACVGACPASALLDNTEKPQLRLIEKNCVQCGSCANTCPEKAITLLPRLNLAQAGKARREPQVLNEMQPYRCVSCSKPFGTLKGVENMMAALAGHSAFVGAAGRRLQMCGDCRVVDIFGQTNEKRITDL